MGFIYGNNNCSNYANFNIVVISVGYPFVDQSIGSIIYTVEDFVYMKMVSSI